MHATQVMASADKEVAFGPSTSSANTGLTLAPLLMGEIGPLAD